MLRDQGRDLHAEFLDLLPARPQPIRIQRWSARRVALLLLMVPVAILLAVSFRTVLVNNDATLTPLARRQPRLRRAGTALAGGPIGAVGLPGALRAITARRLDVRRRQRQERLVEVHPRPRSRRSSPALVVRLTADCDTTGATPTPSDQPGTRRYERTEPGHSGPPTTWHTVFPGGCVTAEFRSTSNGDASLIDEAASAIGFTTRPALQQALDQRSNGRLHLDRVCCVGVDEGAGARLQ